MSITTWGWGSGSITVAGWGGYIDLIPFISIEYFISSAYTFVGNRDYSDIVYRYKGDISDRVKPDSLENRDWSDPLLRSKDTIINRSKGWYWEE